VTEWFRERRAVRFECVATERGTRTRVIGRGAAVRPPLTIRVHRPAGNARGEAAPGAARSSYVDMPWTGAGAVVAGSSESGPDTTPLNLATA